MGAEVAAGRLLAPSFGTSTLVWSALIGAVLGALAMGSILGGRWSRRARAVTEVFAATAASGAMLVALPAVTRPLMRTTLEQFMSGHLVGLALAFTAVLALLVVPVVLLGAVSPVLVQHATGDRDDVGRTAGRLGAFGTLGSLAGTFACGLVLVPLLGTEATFRACGGFALFVGGLGATLSILERRASLRLAQKGGAAAVAALSAVIVACAAPPAPARSGPAPVVERETPYNYLRVVDRDGLRTLYLNEGYAAQSVARLDGHAYLRGVWGYYAIAPAFTKLPPERILVVGLGGGTSAKDYAQRFPRAEVVAVELDAGVVDVARREFGLSGSVDVHVADARAFLAADASSYDLVVVDAFQFPYVPFQLATREFFTDVRRHLRDGGALMINVGRKGDQLDLVHAVASTLEEVFPHVNGVNVPHATNSMLVATGHALDEAGGARNVHFSETENRELEALAPLHPWTVPRAARLLLTDDRAPIEWLTHRIVLREIGRMLRSS